MVGEQDHHGDSLAERGRVMEEQHAVNGQQMSTNVNKFLKVISNAWHQSAFVKTSCAFLKDLGRAGGGIPQAAGEDLGTTEIAEIAKLPMGPQLSNWCGFTFLHGQFGCSHLSEGLEPQTAKLG